MKRKKTRIKKIFAVCMILCLLITGIGIVYMKKHDVPVEIKYKLSDLPEDKAIMVIWSYIQTPTMFKNYYVIVNKKGNYKYILQDDFDSLAEKLKYDEADTFNSQYSNIDFFDTILQMEEIPYQKERIWLNPYFLQRAINLKEVKIPEVFNATGGIPMSYRMVYGLEDRKLVVYRTGASNCDYEVPTLGYMLRTMAKYDEMVKKKIKANFEKDIN